MGILLLLSALVACTFLIKAELADDAQTIRRTVAVSAIALVVSLWGMIPFVLPRFVRQIGLQGVDDLRYTIWEETLVVATAYAPWGSGFGTFEQVYQAFEPLQTLSSNRINHAHNEYLQILVEGGLMGAILLLAAIAWFVRQTWVAWRNGLLLGRAASIVLGVYVMHSMVDYPLRTVSHAAFAGVFVALLTTRGASLAKPGIR